MLFGGNCAGCSGGESGIIGGQDARTVGLRVMGVSGGGLKWSKIDKNYPDGVFLTIGSLLVRLTDGPSLHTTFAAGGIGLVPIRG